MSKQPILAISARKMRIVDEVLTTGDTRAIADISEPIGVEFDSTSTDELVAYALKKFGGGKERNASELDAFLAPRVHNVLRMPRQAAGLPGVWTWLAVGPFRRYMDHRWPLSEASSLWRFTSRDVLRNGVSRLWWAAEMLRDGPDYSLVPLALRSVRRFQFVSELKYSMHRECARAFARVVAEADASDELCQSLSKRFNVYLRAQALECWDYADVDSEARFDASWAGKVASLKELTGPVEELNGPTDGRSRSDVEQALFQWLEALLHEEQ
jgi:hypothetical protein